MSKRVVIPFPEVTGFEGLVEDVKILVFELLLYTIKRGPPIEKSMTVWRDINKRSTKGTDGRDYHIVENPDCIDFDEDYYTWELADEVVEKKIKDIEREARLHKMKLRVVCQAWEERAFRISTPTYKELSNYDFWLINRPKHYNELSWDDQEQYRPKYCDFTWLNEYDGGGFRSLPGSNRLFRYYDTSPEIHQNSVGVEEHLLISEIYVYSKYNQVYVLLYRLYYENGDNEWDNGPSVKGELVINSVTVVKMEKFKRMMLEMDYDDIFNISKGTSLSVLEVINFCKEWSYYVEEDAETLFRNYYKKFFVDESDSDMSDFSDISDSGSDYSGSSDSDISE